MISFVTGIRKWLRGKDVKRFFYNANAIWNLNVNELSESAKGAGPSAQRRPTDISTIPSPMRMRPSPSPTCPSPSHHPIALARRRRRRGRTDSIHLPSISHEKRRRRRRRRSGGRRSRASRRRRR